MTCTYKHAIRPNASLSHVQIATNGTYLVLPYTRNTVGVWSLQDLACKPLKLEGHRKAVTALNLSHYSSPTLLCSAAEDFIIVWNIEHARASLAAGNQIRGKVIGKTFGAVQYVTFSRDDHMVAVCVERIVYILKTQDEELEATLEGHSGTVTCAEFCPHYAATLVTGSDDRTFKVWDILNSCMVYQSAIISSSPFISLAMNPQVEQFAIGTSDGQVRVYDLTDGNGFRMLNHIDVNKMVFRIKQDGKLPDALSPRDPGPKTISSRPSWRRNPEQNPSDLSQNADEGPEAGNAVLGLYYKYPPSAGRPDSARKLSFLQADDTVVSNLLDVAPILVVGTTGSLIQINIRTLDCCNYIDLQEPLIDENDFEEPNKVVTAAGSYCFGPSRKHQESWCIIGSLFQRVVHVLNLAQPTQKDLEALASKGVQKNLNIGDTSSGYVPSCSTEPDEEEQPLTVLSRVPLCAKSPLRSELVPKTKERPPISRRRSSTSSISSSSSTPGLIDKKGKIVDGQPLTFKTQIKSSGYTAESPRTKMFQPQTTFSKNKPVWKTSRSSSMDSSVTKASVKEYPMDSLPPTNLHMKIDADVKPTAITKCSFSGDGQYLACALANKSGQVFKMPLSGKASSLLGHNGPLNHIHWSRDSKWMVTSADDKRACVWSKGQSDPVLIIDTMRHNMDIDKEGKPKTTKENPLFTKEIRHAQFYFMDKFILLTSGNAFYLYKYHLDPSKSDIKRYLTNNRYRIVKTFQMEEAQGITAFTAVNSFNSYISFCAGTNKSVEVFDLNVGKSVRVVADAHTRPVHTICLNEGSSFVSQPPSAYDLYVTAAAGDCKMWDLRTNRCVQRYEGHQDRVHPCGVAISPCSRFIATGAEDRSAYIYDVRAGTYLHKLTGHTDVVTDVAFHPVYAQLVTTTLDGKIRLFKEK